jgi:hypothetical protein
MLEGTWIISSIWLSLSALGFLLLLDTLFRVSKTEGDRPFMKLLLVSLALSWVVLWLLLYLHVRRLVWENFLDIGPSDLVRGAGLVIIPMMVGVAAGSLLACLRSRCDMLPERARLSRYLLITLIIFLLFGFLFPQGFPKISSTDARLLDLTELHSSCLDSPALSWAQLRRGDLSPSYWRIAFDSLGRIDVVLARFVSKDGLGSAFVYKVSGALGRGYTSRRLPLVIYPTRPRRTVPDFTDSLFEKTLRKLDDKGIMSLVGECLVLYGSEAVGRDLSFELEVGTISLEVEQTPKLGVALTAYEGGRSDFTCFFEPSNLSLIEP